MRHDVTWTAPQPYWNAGAGVAGRATLAQPQILRFANDEFMPELLSQLEQDPASLPRYTVQPETWRGPAGPSAVPPDRWLQREPKKLQGLRRLVQKRERAGTAVATVKPAASQAVLKLYQPAHMRHYLVCGALVCRNPGLPDRHVEPGRQKVSVVLRRLFPKAGQEQADPATWDEHAFLPHGKGGTWAPVGSALPVLPAEERLGTFPTHFVGDDGHARRLFVGSVPVGRREAYQGASRVAAAPQPGAAVTPEPVDPRLAIFRSEMLARWKAMAGQVMRQTTDPDPKKARPDFLFDTDSDPDHATFLQLVGFPNTMSAKGKSALNGARSSLQTSSWYLLLDLRDFLLTHIDANFLAARPAAGAKRDLYDALAGTSHTIGGFATETNADAKFDQTAYGSVRTDLIQALRDIEPFRDELDAATQSFVLPPSGQAKPAGWPDFLFLFADPWFGVLQPPQPAVFQVPAADYLSEKVQARIESLAALVAKALQEVGPAPAGLPEPGLATMTPADMREGWYVLRLVYERPDCQPFHDTVVSAPTVPFQMAGFFDPDAPARPIRIGLPLDISPAGLRKFDRNTVFMLSDMLCGQIDRMKGMTLADLVLSVLPWPFHKDLNVPEKGDCKDPGGNAIGMMCSLSIPIVTIAAILLLLIIVSLLDFVFRWMPYLIACFPVPGLKGKK